MDTDFSIRIRIYYRYPYPCTSLELIMNLQKNGSYQYLNKQPVNIFYIGHPTSEIYNFQHDN